MVFNYRAMAQSTNELQHVYTHIQRVDCVCSNLLNRRQLRDVKLDILIDLAISQLARDGSILVTKVSCLCHVAEETYFHDASEKFDLV